MKIVSWNANGAFRKKYKDLLSLDADVYVVQESENPESIKDTAFRETVVNGFWVGGYRYKGMLVFTTRPDVKLELLDWKDGGKRYFMPIRVNDSFIIVAAWACDPYCEELYDWIDAVEPNINEDTIIIGDLNSNVVLDPKHIRKSGKSYALCLEKLSSLGLYDIWHHYTKEKQGKESVPTFYLYRHLDKPYHLDHCLANPNLVKSMKINARWNWLALSDHLPIEIEL